MKTIQKNIRIKTNIKAGRSGNQMPTSGLTGAISTYEPDRDGGVDFVRG